MATEFHINVFNTSGVLQAQIDDYWALALTRRVWEPGQLQFDMSANSPYASAFTQDCIVQLQRRNIAAGVQWYTEFNGIFKKLEITTTDHDIMTVTAPGVMTLLSERQVAYPANTSNYTIFAGQNSEFIMKQLVRYNCDVSYATTGNGRDRTPNTLNVSVANFSSVRGNTMDWKCIGHAVLDELQQIAQSGAGGDFDLRWGGQGTNTYSFDFYPGQLGTDRRTTQIFSLANGNMANPVYTLDRSGEVTICIVRSRTSLNGQPAVVVQGANYSTTNDIEMVLGCAETDTTQYKNAKGASALYNQQARSKLTFDPVQTDNSQYGRDYTLGDLATAYYRGVSYGLKIHGVNIMHSKNGSATGNEETIQIELRTP